MLFCIKHDSGSHSCGLGPLQRDSSVLLKEEVH